MIVVVDTNVWLAEVGLNSHAGTALRFFMRQQNARLGLPEVIRLEVKRHLRADLHEHREQIRRSHRSLLAHFGQLKEIVLPSDVDIDGKVDQYFTSLGVDVLEIPLCLDSARASFMKTIEKVPPSDRTQQFKDGVIWADCVALLEEDDVALVGADKAFYRERKYEAGLAVELEAELRGRKHKLTLHPNLGALLKVIQTKVVIADRELADAMSEKSDGSMERLAERTGFALGGLLRATSRLFITEQPDKLFVECEVEYECTDNSPEGRTDGRIRQKATGMYDQAAHAFADLTIVEEELRCVLSDGTAQNWRNSYMSGVAHLGHRSVRHQIRQPID